MWIWDWPVRCRIRDMRCGMRVPPETWNLKTIFTERNRLELEMKNTATTPPRTAVTLLFIGLVSAAVLAYQLLLTRILSVQYWSYFASMIISLAMLGFAASGTALFLASRRGRGSDGVLPWMTVLFVFSLTLCPKLAQMIECVPLMVLWDRAQLAN